MTQRPSEAAVQGRFDGAPLDERGVYRAYRDGAAFMVAMPTAHGEVRRRVELVTGSHHMQVYWVAGRSGALEAFAFALPEAFALAGDGLHALVQPGPAAHRRQQGEHGGEHGHRDAHAEQVLRIGQELDHAGLSIRT